ncbi:MAG TPA: hypothetical protein DCO89_02020 [Clostridiales bacterium]|nr:hypothetical protein [Clostridiales bacterium]
MLLDIFSSIIDTLGNLTASLGYVWMVVIGLSLDLLAIIISFICTQFSIELKTLRAVNKLNKYLELNPFVTEDNLVEFNKLMKRIPNTMRKQWQQFMVSRDKKPSEFFSEQNCVDKPFKASAYASHITAVRTSIISIALIGFIFGISYFASGAANNQFSFSSIATSLLLPIVTIFIGEIYVLFLKARRNSTISDVYYNFDMFQKYLDRAVTTLPDYVDYEILFTRKEIVAGIPVLQEYLQQRALFEQEQIKKAKDSQVVHELYDFSALGINGSLVMEKAMQVSEQFIGNKNGTRAVISELEGERDLLEKNYDEKAKAAQRKLRDIQETLDRLKEKLDATTNLIVGNDLRKQRENEIQKQRQIEKEAQEDNRKFEEERKKINEQIEAKRAEIEEDRKRAETSLNSEFKSYADKIYSELKAIVDEQSKEEIEGLKAETAKLQMEIEERDRIVVEKNAIYDETLEKLQNSTQKIEEQEQVIAEQESRLSEYGNVDDDRNQEIFSVKQELESRKMEIARKDEIIVKKDEQIANQKEYISELKHKKRISGDEVYADVNGRMYFIDEEGHKKYVNQDGQGEPEQNSEVAEPDYAEVKPEEKVEEPAEEVAEQPSEAVEAPMDGSLFDEVSSSSAEELTSKVEEQVGSKEEPVEVNLDELKSRFHKPVYDFKWENSNSLSAVEEEEQPSAEEEKEAEEDAVEEVKEEPKPTSKKAPSQKVKIKKPKETKPAVQKVEASKKDELEELDKLIEEKSAELEKQNKNLSKQLEETKKVAEKAPKSSKKSSPKKSSAKPKAKKPAVKKPVKAKSTSKKASAKKSAPSVKPSVEKQQKPAKSGSGFDTLNLAQFNEQLKNMLKDIDDNSGDNK